MTAMSKKILVISSSPRRGGNSDALCDSFVKGAADAGHDAEKIFLADKKVGYCKGCYTCAATGKCFQKDDAAEIIEKMVNADVIVLGTPVYFYTMCAQLKTLIDRCVPRYREISNKEFYYILAAADSAEDTLDGTIESIRCCTRDCLTGTVEKGIIRGTGFFKVGEVKNSPLLQEAYEAGKNA